MMHFSLSKNVSTGLEESKTKKEEPPETNLAIDPKRDQDIRQNKLPKETNSETNILSNSASTDQAKSSYSDNEHTTYR